MIKNVEVKVHLMEKAIRIFLSIYLSLLSIKIHVKCAIPSYNIIAANNLEKKIELGIRKHWNECFVFKRKIRYM